MGHAAIVLEIEVNFMTWSPKDVIAEISGIVIAAAVAAIPGAGHIAEAAGAAAKGGIMGISKKEQTPKQLLDETVKTAILKALDEACIEEPYEMPDNCKEAIISELFDVYNARKYFESDNNEKLLSDTFSNIAGRYDECEIKTIPVQKIIKLTVGYINDGMSDELKTLAYETNMIVKNNQRLLRKIDTRLTSDENSKVLNENALKNYISARKEIVINQAIFPWFDKSLKYREVFPELFVFPEFETRRGKCGFNELLTLKNRHLIILGEAGAGKSTLLRFIFAFNKLENIDCFYMTADEIADNTQSFFIEIQEQKIRPNDDLIIFIDGIDEAYHNDYNGYKQLIAKLKAIKGCYFWLGCRSDYYRRFIGENVIFAHEHLTVQPWDEKQSEHFVSRYSIIVNCRELPERIEKLAVKNDDLKRFRQNPFQLALLTFLVENNETEINGIYDLYEKFVRQWIDRELKRGSCRDNKTKIIEELQFAAEEIYDGKKYKVTETVENNTAVKDLLIIDNNNIAGADYAASFYHRSLAAFFLARSTIVAMLENETDKLKKLFAYELKDDVTNFIGDVFRTISVEDKYKIKENLAALYETTGDSEEDIHVKEQTIYFITRLGIDASDFLMKLIEPRPVHPIMRLTLAYGCVLSDVPEVKEFALEYAKSIAADSNDAIINRAWTVVYFADIGANPYEYKDDEKCSWSNARGARIKRFTNKNPRPKDYRFRLFDIPLFYSFLKDREWNNISPEEFNILRQIELPKENFNEEELSFLHEQKTMLLSEYKKHLDGESYIHPEQKTKQVSISNKVNKDT